MARKKKKYTPGWQQQQIAKDRETMQKAADVLDAYYEAQALKNQLDEQESNTIQQSGNTATPNENNTREESERTDTEVSQQSPAQQQKQQKKAELEKYGSAYSTESPESYLERTSDPTAFKDQFIPSILDPEYDEWAKRQAQKASNIPVENQTTADKVAISHTNLQSSIQKDIENGKELATDRMNRRIRENNTFGRLNKDKALTYDEAKEIDQYRIMTDPLYANDRIKQLRQQVEEMEKQENEEYEGVEEPENYTGSFNGLPVGMGGTFNLGNKLMDLAKSAWGKSFFSDFMEETNASQLKVSIGQIQRSKELVDISDRTAGYMDLLNQYVNNLAQLQRFDQRGNLSATEKNLYGDILEENRAIRQQLQEADWWKDANNLASWAPSGIGGRIAGMVDKIIDDDLGGIRNNLYGLGDKLDDLTRGLNVNDHSEKWLEGITDQIGKIKQQLNEFNAYTSEKQSRWQDQALTDAQDIADWRSGDNWLGVHTQVDPYYKAQKHLLEASEFDWSDPVKMAQFGWSGIAGGSNSSWWKSIIGQSAKWGGFIGGAVTSGGTSAAIQIGAIGTAFEADKSAGSDENNIEANEKTGSALRSKLITSEKYNAFLEEGLKQLQEKQLIKKPTERSYIAEDGTLVKLRGDDDIHYNPDAIKRVLESSDPEKLKDFIMDMFLAGMWHSSDPEITRMHADAVIGTNNQFYNNQPVNTADAAIGAIVDIANLEPVKYLARATKITGKLVDRSLARGAVGLQYQGFKKGVHNVANSIADNQITQLTKAGIIKTAEAGSKIPLGVVVGSIAGADAGLYASDGSYLGMAAGAVVGGATGALLHKAPKLIGVEDKISKAYQSTRSFASRVPKIWMGASSITKTVTTAPLRLGTDTASEMFQEGVQALNQRDTEYDSQYNRPMVNRIFDDMMLAAKSAYIWLNQDDPEMKSESEVYSQMNATPLLTLFGPAAFQVGVRFKNGIKDYQLAMAVANNMEAARRGNIAELEQAKEYALRITPEDKQQMKQKFEQFRKIAGTHADAERKLNPNASDQALMEEDKHFIPNELIDEQEKDYEDIYTLANSSQAKVLGAKQYLAKKGLPVTEENLKKIPQSYFHSEDYAKVVSMLNFRRKRKTEAFEALKAKDAENDATLGQSSLEGYIQSTEAAEERARGNFEEEFVTAESPDENQKTSRQNIVEKNDLAKILVRTAALIEIVNDYSTLQKLSGKDDTFLNRSKSKLSEYKKILKQHGINVETVDDVVNELNVSEEGQILQTLINRSLPQDQQGTLSMEDYLHTYMGMMRDRELLEFDFLMEEQMMQDFLSDPDVYIDKWNNRLKSDKQLEAILEEDYVNTIRAYESAAAREVKDGDIYVGDDGYWYITKKVGDKFEKHRYHPNSRKIDSEALQFNPIEYDQAKKQQEEVANKRNAVNNANTNIQNGVSEEQTKEKPIVEQQQIEEPSEQEENNKINVGDFVNTGTGVAQVIGTDDDGRYILSYGSGRPEVNTADPATLTKVTSPIAPAQYATGDIITTPNGKKYTVGDVYLEGVDKDTYEPTYTYDLIDVDTGETLPIQTQEQIDKLTAAPPESRTGSTVIPNDKQNEVIQQLEEKRKSDKRNTELSGGEKRRSGHDYFIKIKQKITRFVRVHGILDNLFEDTEYQKINRRQYRNELALLYKDSKKKFQDRVIELQDEYNKAIENKYGKDSEEYDYYKIDLSYYLRGNVLNDEGIIDAIASILSSEEPGPAVVVGSIIDEIARDFFNPDVDVVNKPKYRMSDNTFNTIISQLNNLQERFNDLGWVVDTYSYTWYGQFSNGIRMAGETDMIAVDREGNIHILDFKTTASSYRFNTVLQYKTETLSGEETWIEIDPANVPEGAETRISSSFLDEIATKDGGKVLGKRTYAAQYARQLEAYRLLIQQTTGRNVSSIEVIPFAVDYDTQDSKVTKIKKVKTYEPVDLSKVESLKSDVSEIDNYLTSDHTSMSSEEVSDIIEGIQNLIDEARSKAETKGIAKDTAAKIYEAIEILSGVIVKFNKIKDDKIKLSDSVYTQGLLSERDAILPDLNYRLQQADEQISKYEDADKGEPDKPIIDDKRSWLNEEPEEIVESDKKHWWNFNSLHSFSDAIKSMKDYMKSNIKSDFIKNATFVISRDDANDLDVFSVTITYRGITFRPIEINLGKNNACPEDMRNYRTVMDQYLGAMGRNFLRQYYQLAKNLKPGERIVATKITRTNGTIRYAGKNINLQDTAFFSKKDPRLLSLINDVNSLVGVTDGGIVIEVGSGNRQPIWSPQMDSDGNVVVKKIRDKITPGNIGNDSLPDGVVIFLHKFKNEEDPEDADMRVVPLVLQGKQLSGYDGNLILKILLDIANSKTPGKLQNELFTFKAKLKEGGTRDVTVPGLTNLKVIKLLTRFGKQAEYANDEFIFDYATKDDGTPIAGHKVIRITDMRATAVEDQEGNLHRPTVDLDLRKQEDCDQLLEILALTQMHINQMGIMRASLNTDDESSPFGALRTFFMDEANQDVQSILFTGNTQIDIDDVFADENDPTKGLTGIAWAVKHGYAGTNAQALENPIISIHELGVESNSKKTAAKKKKDIVEKKAEKPETDQDKPTVSVQQDEPKPAEQQPVSPAGEKDPTILAMARQFLEEDDDLDTKLPGGGRVVESLREKPITKEEKDAIEKRLRRLLGRVKVEWTEGAIEVLKSGASVAGRTVVNAIKLSDRLTEGTELHEAFHRIFEILIPNGRRQKMYDIYREKYNEQFKRANGRDLTDKDISEDFAEMFRLWVLNKQEVKLHWNILKTFKEIKQYSDDLKALGDRRFAALFMLANSGVFRFVKPNKANVEHFMTVLEGQADLSISGKNSEGKLIKVNLDKFPAFGGRSLFNDAINGIIYALCTGYSIDMLASNAARLKTSRQDIANLFRGKEKTEHSSWFRVLTGEYTNPGEEFTFDDANTYYRIYKQSDEIQELAYRIMSDLAKEGKADRKEFKVRMLAAIYSQEKNRKPEDLNQNQKMMAQLFNEDTWWLVEKKINNKLHKMSIDSELRTEEEYTDVMDNGPEDTDDIEEESVIGSTVHDHQDDFYDHARTDDATAAIRFFLSSIPDERFATEDDVESGVVRSTIDKEGNPVTISNSVNLLGYQQFLSMKVVSNKLLLACHDVSSVQELDEKLQKLASTDPIFYRIAKKYRSALQNEIKHTKDGKNRISVYDKKNKEYREVPSNMYEQGKDELGWYYTWTEEGENPGQRIEGAITQTNPDMESFVTQLFNYVACQKIDFIMVTLQQEVDNDGEAIDGSYTPIVRSSDSDYAASVYPGTWFARLRGGISGIFKVTTSGRYTFTSEGKQLLSDAINTLHKVKLAFSSTGLAKIHGKELDKNTDEGFRAIEFEFIKALNTLGIDITKEALEYYLQEQFGRDLTIRQAFGQLISRKEQDTSFQKFLDDMDDFKSRVTERGENSVLTQDRDEETTGFGRNLKKTKRSGNYIYSKNGFVKWMSRAVSRYNKTASEIMTNGPEGTKRYTLAQSHTASDMTDDYKKAILVDGQIKGSRMLRDMRNYLYNCIEGTRGIPKGSLIVKQLYFSAKKNLENLVLHTHGGVKVEGDYTGGVSYRKITEREDWIAKAAILKQGGIIFPTLSDKSTWFYLTGVNVPGIDYSSISTISPSKMLHLGLHNQQNADSTEVHIKFDFSVPNAQLDQMIEYAECERAAIEREINRGKKGTMWENLKKLPFIEFFDENRKRFGGLSEVVVMRDGKAQLEIINDYNMSPEDCLKKADELFFNKTAAEKRQIMALTLEEGFMRNMAMLERAGLISASGELKEAVLDKDGKPTGKTRLQNRLLQYKNIGLDSEAIKSLRSLYISEYNIAKNTNITVEQAQRAESQAICAYVWDIYLRGVISNEETERMYTGQPQFFSWKHDKIKDALSGKTLHVLTDRHSDESKRLGGLGSTGDKNRTDLANMRRKYVCAEVEDQKVASKLYSEVKQSFIDNYVRGTYFTYKEQQVLTNDELSKQQKDEALDTIHDEIYGENKKSLDSIKEELEQNGFGSAYATALASAEKDASAYSGDINVADGAAYITPKMAKDLLRQRGRFTSRVKQAFDILEGKAFEDGKHINPLSNKDAFFIIQDALLGAQKYSAYGYRIDESTGDIPVHYYNKFALFPIFPQIATGFTSDILSKMEEQGIDMLMMHSAVKTGSQEASECTPDMFENAESFKKFKFKTYEQDFAFIRRQLNTDPHERDTVAMGTQMTKIALTNLNKWAKYTMSDGKSIRGRDLLKNIMDSINALSDIGKEKIEKEFFTNGELDLEKFSTFLEEELERRDADANMLDGIEIEEDSDGTQHFKVPLEAMSSIDWIQSIIVSKINKEVCDINVKGNAFYQRSVWGMEGHPKVLDDKKVNFKMNNINNGDDLNFINEDGSMDAVISIDFFEDIIPEGIRGNFNKSKQWLIDHNIIGKNATANTIASRIPTQAQSSIHALRFVDVLPIVRDTIILPKEFTKITGSDFDIDKLYLCRLGYKVSTKKEGDKLVDTVTTDYGEDVAKTEYHRNKLINGYLTLLKQHGKMNEQGLFENGNSIHISMRSIDDDTNLIKNVLKRIEANRPVERSYAYKFGNIAFQVATKAAFMIGKFGIGPFALNNNSQVLTQLYGVKFARSSSHTNILDSLGCLDLSNPRDKQNNSVLSWLSGLINAHVDVAKDPYIRRLNINAFTYNLTNLLIRTGMGERTLLFTAQPIMVELARVYDDASGSYMVDISKSKSARQKAATKNFVIDAYKRGNSTNGDIKFINEMLMGPKNSDEENMRTEEVLGSYAKALFGIDDNGKYVESFEYIDPSTGDIVEKQGCILEDILTNPEALESTKKGFTFDNMQGNRPLYRVTVKNRNGAMEQIDMTPKDVQLYTYFIQNALAKYGQKLSDLVNACKIDTKKQGKSYVEQQAYMDKYDQLFNNEDGMFEDEGLKSLKEDSYIDTKTKNATELYERVLSQISIQSNYTFKEAHDKILKKLNSSVQNKQLSKKVTTAIMTWLKSRYFEHYVDQKGQDYFNNLFYGKDSIQSRLIKIQNEIKNDRTGKFSKFGDNGDITLGENGTITNPLLRALQPDVYEKKGGFNHPQFVKLENALLDDSDNINALERAWNELYMDTYHYTEDENGTRHYYIKEFAEDLAIYAFLTSGDKSGTTKFFKAVPNPIRTGLSIKMGGEDSYSYAQYMRHLQDMFVNGEFDFSDEDLDDIIGQNWQDNDFVKEVKMTMRRGKKRFAINTSFGRITTKSEQTVAYKKKNGKMGFRKESIVKTVNLYIAGVKKTDKGLKESIHRCNDDNYPPYIKVRRAGSTKYDADNFLLYKFKEASAIDPQDPNSDTFPVYELVSPKTSTLRAGSYDYLMYNYGNESPSYPLEMQDIVRKLAEDFLTSEENMNDALKEFKDALNAMGVTLEDQQLAELLEEEFEGRGFEYTDQEFKTALKWVKDRLKAPEEGGVAGKKGKKKTIKRVVEKSDKKESEQKKVEVGDLFDEDEEITIQDQDQSETEQQEIQSLEDDDLSLDDFNDTFENICKNGIKPE